VARRGSLGVSTCSTWLACGSAWLAWRLAFFLVDVYTYIQATYVVSFAWLP